MSNDSSSNHAFTDLMTSLVVIFILLLVSVLYKMLRDRDRLEEIARKYAQQERSIENARTNVANLEKVIEVNVQKAISRKLLKDPEDPDFTRVIVLEEELLFATGQKTLSDLGMDRVQKIAAILGPILCDPDEKNRNNVDSFIIEGHADKQRDADTRGKLENIALSQERAFAVMGAMYRHLDGNPTVNLTCFQRFARVIGRGAINPLSPIEDAPINRRVELKIRFKNKISD